MYWKEYGTLYPPWVEERLTYETEQDLIQEFGPPRLPRLDELQLGQNLATLTEPQPLPSPASFYDKETGPRCNPEEYRRTQEQRERAIEASKKAVQTRKRYLFREKQRREEEKRAKKRLQATQLRLALIHKLWPEYEPGFYFLPEKEQRALIQDLLAWSQRAAG